MNKTSRILETEEKYRLLAENASDGIYIRSREGFEYVNPAFEDIIGFKADEIKKKGFDILELIHPADIELIEQKRDARKKGLSSPDMSTFRIFNRDGQIRHVQANIVSLPGNEAKIMGILRDITPEVKNKIELRRSLLKLENMLWGTVQALALITEMRDPYTSGHQNRVSQISLAIAEELGLEEKNLESLRMASLLHDIGKIQVPTELLNKPARLTEAEFNLIKLHPHAASDILNTIEFSAPVATIVLQHHERLDGTGYPQGLGRDSILLEAKILAVADVVEAMASHRPYRPALRIDRTLEYIRKNRGRLFDPDVVNVCIKIISSRKTLLDDRKPKLDSGASSNRAYETART